MFANLHAPDDSPYIRMSPKAHDVRAIIPSDSRRRSNVIAIAICIVVFGFYAVTFAGILLPVSLALSLLCAVLNGVMIALLFIIGHDACHISFAEKPWQNHLIGRLAFLPSFYPFTCWELGHNRLHHCWTNLRSRDYAWAPHSLAEYGAMSAQRRWLERVYRHPLGLGIYSLVKIWWQHMIWPDKQERAKMPRWRCALDRLIVMTWMVIQVSIIYWFAGERSKLGMLLIGFFCAAGHFSLVVRSGYLSSAHQSAHSLV